MDLAPVIWKVTEADWDRFKDIIQELYLGKKLLGDGSVQQEMKERYNFNQTKAQYEKHIRTWGLIKNRPKKTWEIVARKVNKRKQDGKDSDVYIGGQLVPPKSSRKHFSATVLVLNVPLSPMSQVNFCIETVAQPCTPEGIMICTPSAMESEMDVAFDLPSIQFYKQFDSVAGSFLTPYVVKISTSGHPTMPGDVDRRFKAVIDLSGTIQYGDLKHAVMDGDRTRYATGVRAISFENTTHAQQLPSISEGQTETRNSRERRMRFESYLPQHYLELISKQQTEIGIFLILMTFFLSNNLDVSHVARDIMMLWLQAQPNLTLFIRLLSGGGTTSNVLKEKLFGMAVSNGDSNLIRALLNSGVHPDTPIFDKRRTALGIACESRNFRLVELLLAAGADVNKLQEDGFQIYEGLSPLSLAISGKSPSYYSYEAKPEVGETLVLQLVKILVRSGADIKSSLVVQAVAEGYEELAYYLLDEGADLNGGIMGESSPLSAALFNVTKLGSDRCLRIIKRLVQAGANIQPRSTRYLETPLDEAARAGHSEIFEFLYRSGARPTSDTLRHATSSQNQDMVRLTIEIGAVESCPARSWKDHCIIIAIQERDHRLFQLLFDSNAACRHESVFIQSIKESAKHQMDEVLWHLFSARERYKGIKNKLNLLLRSASAVKNVALVKALLDAGASADTEALAEAIQSNASSVVSLLLDAGAEVNLEQDLTIRLPDTDSSYYGWSEEGSVSDFSENDSKFDHEQTPLEEAARSGDRAVLQRILQQGALTNRLRALRYVIRHNDLSLVTMLLDAGSRVNVDRRSIHETPLQAAVRSGEACIVEELLYRGADVNGTTNGSELPPLHIAIKQRRLDLVQILLSAGADINDPTAKLRDESALALAIEEGDINMVNFLLANAADPDDSGALASAVSKDDTEMTTRLLNARSWQHPVCRRGFGCKALHIAIEERYTELTDLLLSWGVDPNVRYRCRTALGVAIRNAKWYSMLDTVRKLLGAGASPNIIVETWDYRGKNFRDRTALLLALSYEEIALIELLLEFGANVNEPARGRILRTPLQAACEIANLEAIRLLLSRGAHINAPPARQAGATALQFAAISGHIGIATLRLQRGADVNAPAAKVGGRTALEGAAEHGRTDMVKLLLNAGAMINGPGESQYARAIQFAKENGHTGARETLEEFPSQYTEGR